MTPINFSQIEQQAHEMRAEEIRRLSEVSSKHLRAMVSALGRRLLSGLNLISETLRPLFSWVPDERKSH